MFAAGKAFRLKKAAGGGGNTYATWNPSDKNANITLSNGNLTVSTGSASWAGVRSTIGKSSGKWYWERTVSGIFVASGVANASASLADYIGSDINGWSYLGYDGHKATNGDYSAPYGAAYSAGDVIGVALDMDAGTLVFLKNNVSQGVAFSGLTGTIFAANAVYPGYTTTDNFGATTLTYTPPSGHNAGLYT